MVALRATLAHKLFAYTDIMHTEYLLPCTTLAHNTGGAAVLLEVETLLLQFTREDKSRQTKLQDDLRQQWILIFQR